MRGHYRQSLLVSFTSALVLWFSPGRAQHKDAGTEIFPFLNLNLDARSIAMAGASAAIPNDGYGAFTNPASLAFITTGQPVIGYRQVGVGIFCAPIAYARPVEGAGTFAVSGVGMSGGIDVMDIGPDGTPFEAGLRARSDNYTGALSWASKVNENVAAGITLQGVYSYLTDGSENWSSDGIVLNGGIQYRSWNSRVVYGLTVHNIGLLRSGYEEDDSYPLPAAVELGVSYVPQYLSMLRISLDLNKEFHDYLLFEPGLEIDLIPRQLIARFGYALSWRDFEAFFANLKGEPEDHYYRNNRATFCGGVGIVTELIDRTVRLDAAVEFSDAFAPPALVISMLTDL